MAALDKGAKCFTCIYMHLLVYMHLQNSIGNYLPLTIIYHQYILLKTIPVPCVLRIKAFRTGEKIRNKVLDILHGFKTYSCLIYIEFELDCVGTITAGLFCLFPTCE